MRTRVLLTAITGLSLAVAGTVALPAAAAAANAADTVVIDCVGAKVVKPKEIVVTCADAGVEVGKITWKSWGMNSATGKGTLFWNTCLPTTCAGGIVEKYPARIRLDRLASGPNVTAFTRMTLTFPKAAPAGAQSATYLLDNRLAGN